MSNFTDPIHHNYRTTARRRSRRARNLGAAVAIAALVGSACSGSADEASSADVAGVPAEFDAPIAGFDADVDVETTGVEPTPAPITVANPGEVPAPQPTTTIDDTINSSNSNTGTTGTTATPAPTPDPPPAPIPDPPPAPTPDPPPAPTPDPPAPGPTPDPPIAPASGIDQLTAVVATGIDGVAVAACPGPAAPLGIQAVTSVDFDATGDGSADDDAQLGNDGQTWLLELDISGGPNSRIELGPMNGATQSIIGAVQLEGDAHRTLVVREQIPGKAYSIVSFYGIGTNGCLDAGAVSSVLNGFTGTVWHSLVCVGDSARANYYAITETNDPKVFDATFTRIEGNGAHTVLWDGTLESDHEIVIGRGTNLCTHLMP